MIGQAAGGCTLGLLRIEIKLVNCKTCVHQISECECNCISAGVCSGGSTM